MIPGLLQSFGWFVLAVLALVWGSLSLPVILFLMVLSIWCLLLAVSAWRLRGTQWLTVTRQALNTAAVGKPFTMTLTLHNHHHHPLAVVIGDFIPESFTTEHLKHTLTIPADSKIDHHTQMIPTQRGITHFGNIDVRCGHAWCLWQRVYHIPAPFTVRVYPQFRHTHRQGLHSLTGVAQQTQNRHTHTGEDEFNQLRDYVIGDSWKRLDHKASARLQKPLTRQYLQTPQQPIIILLDSSLRMQGEHQNTALFETALNAVTLLSQTAIANGDALGVGIFSAQMKAWQPPKRGNAQYARIMTLCADAQVDDNMPHFITLAKDIRRRVKTSALLIILTSLQETDAKEIKSALALLKKHHQVLLLNIWPPFLQHMMTVHSLESAAAYAAQAMMAEQLHAVLKTLRQQQIDFVSIPAEKITATLLNKYLEYRQPR